MINLYFFLVLNIFLILFHTKLASLIKIYDVPEKKRKIHSKKTAVTGGFILYIGIIFYFFNYIFFLKINNLYLDFFKEFNFYLFFFITTVLFLIGVIDDKYKISPHIRLILISLIIFILIYFDPESRISLMKFSFTDKVFDIGSLSYLWTILCFLLFINAFNMFDGINLQSSSYALFILFFFLYNQFYTNFFIIMIISTIAFIYLNKKNYSFLGDGGCYLISFVLGYFFIKFYNYNNFFYADKILLFMLIPGIDMMRLFIFRLINKKNAFQPDKDHIHHLLLKKYGFTKTFLYIQSLIYIPIILSSFFNKILLIIMVQFFIYFITILKVKS
jgi:UDP-GlcNAc:undecaprenyl-phosphate GlcNAc-1-phosphate transferase